MNKMEDSEVLLENDPLAKYIQHLNIPLEFDLEENRIKDEPLPKNIFEKHKEIVKYNSYQLYRGYILSSQLMFSDDSALVLACSEQTETRCDKKIYISWFLIPISGIMALLSKSKVTSIVCGSICLLKTLHATCIFAKQQYTKNIIYKLVQTFKKFTESIKKYLWNIMQYTTTLNYYGDSLNKSTLDGNLNVHVKTFCNTLHEITLYLRDKSTALVACIQLTFEIENLELIEIPEELKAKHAKILYEYYLLVQSHFLKVVALIFIPQLWLTDKNEGEMFTLFCVLKDINNFMLNRMEGLKKKHKMFLRIGECKSIPNIVNLVQHKMCSTLLTNLHLAEINLYQLISKVRDLQDSIAKDDSENQLIALYSESDLRIREIEKQIDNPKYYVNAASIILQRALNFQTDTNKQELLIDEEREVKEPGKDIITVNPLDPDPPRSNEVYELFIPKEGLLPLEQSQMDDPLLPCNNKIFSTTLMQELKQLLKERNPDIAIEEEAHKKVESDDETDTVEPKLEIFRPQQPVGLFVNQSLQDILAMRKTIQDEEEFIDDTFTDE